MNSVSLQDGKFNAAQEIIFVLFFIENSNVQCTVYVFNVAEIVNDFMSQRGGCENSDSVMVSQ